MKNNIKKLNVIDTIETNYMPYSMSVIVSRALPEIDGLKPSHRKLLYTMYKMGLLKGQKTKSANIVGQTMRLNPHSDMAIYETMVRLTRGNETLLHPYVDSKGNFGKNYSRDMAFAAPRYTEAKLDSICEEFFNEIGNDTVDFVPNYDNTMQEPTLLPTTFPNILVNPNLGIAVGMASSICSFNLRELCDTTVRLLEDEGIDVIEYLKAPDFSSGGELIYNQKDMRKIYEEGRGTFYLRGKYRYDKANSCIDIYEIPYTTNAETIIDQVTELVKAGTIKEITDVRDETDKNGLKITLDIKKSADVEQLMLKIFKYTKLQDSFSCNFNILVNGHPRVLGVKAILLEWIDFRVGCIKRGLRYDIERKTEKLHLLRGLEKILLDLDKAVQIVRDTKKDKEVIPNLMKGFEVDAAQAEFIAEIKLRNFNQEYILMKTKDIKDLEKELKNLEETLNSEKKMKKIIIKQLDAVSKKYGQDRKTDIVEEHHIEEISPEDLIEDYNIKLFLTKEGYLKKIPLISLRGSNGHKLKEGDTIIQEIDGTNKSDLLFFTNKHTVYKKKVYELEDCKTSNLGDYLPNLLALEEKEEIIYMAATADYSGYMLFFFKNGKCAKIDMSSYETKTNRTQLANAYSDSDPLVYLMKIKEDIELVAISSIKKVLIFNTEQINSKTTRNSQGVQVLKSKNSSVLAEIKLIEEIQYQDPDYYRGNIPAVGTFLKKEDEEKQSQQLQFLLEE
ncbi:DNA gyrase/topoisomerase IV subunit A [Geosporobacter ferrireducens]|uniref:Topoisomerase IV n=1 Tax=Geosporobacter ferrireducens TaxID=1424294 RepID=A0A1D8GCR4_9FIRM|nr:DNA topoisomerase (ATP-hydrolyzing) subunit A [Geosporobacter ferrireducens]AOT68694.1 topoisomerase IV [Geosporobacter ferrireducens]MTI57580.1 topoisomerase IV [Geosporobacter ferrireducens]